MLTRLELTKYRCFERHRFDFRQNTVLVGPNNAGKSTVIEALRLISLVTARYTGFTWKSPADWTGLPGAARVATPSMNSIAFDARMVIHRYEDPPATVRATFSNGVTVTVYVGPPPTSDSPPQLAATILDEQKKPVRNRSTAKKIDLPLVAILPQPEPLLQKERILADDYVLKKELTDLTSSHFRNQIRLHSEHFTAFKTLSEESWPGLQIQPFIPGSRLDEQPPELMVRDGDFVTEIGAMGHGLQMWLQTMWFLTRHQDAGCIILDEPDVYMHPDLQRRLIRFLRKKDRQVIVATHSVEIMAEARTDEILVINRKTRASNYANATPAVQRAIEAVGGVHNLTLARLFSARRVLLMEGKDIALLRPLFDKVTGLADAPIDDLPNMPVGGWSGWPIAIGSGLFLKNAVDEDITPYAIFDSDYHTPQEIEERYAQALSKGVEVHIWRKKEIENYLVVPSAILRVLMSRSRIHAAPTVHKLTQFLDSLADELRDDVIGQFADSMSQKVRAWNPSKCMKEAGKLLEDKLSTTAQVLNRASGKEVHARISQWAQVEFGVSYGVVAVSHEIRSGEIESELANVLRTVARGHRFTQNLNRGWWAV